MDEFQKITEKMHQIYLKKNKDYGSSFDRQYDKYGMTSVLIRLSDKLNRLEQITKSGTIEVKDESIDDTLLDLANYAILTLIKRQKGKTDSGDAAFVDIPEAHETEKEVPKDKIEEPNTANGLEKLIINHDAPCDAKTKKEKPTIKEGIKNDSLGKSVMEDLNEASNLNTKRLANKTKELYDVVAKFKESKQKETGVNDEKDSKKTDDKGYKTSVSMWVDEGDGLKEVDPENYPITSLLEDIIGEVFSIPTWTDRIIS